MSKKHLKLNTILILCIALGLPAFGDAEVIEISAENQLALQRNAAPVSIQRANLDIPVGETVRQVQVEKHGGTWTIPYQMDDLDGDGNWEEIFFTLNIGPRQTVPVTLRTGEKPTDSGTFPRRVQAFIRHGAEQQGVTNAVLESELILYRIYGSMQADPIGKPVAQLVSDFFWREDSHGIHDYHPGYGQDFFYAGNTLGANSIFLQEADGNIDRPWTNDAYHLNGELDDGAKTEYHLALQGPLRSRIRVEISNWVTSSGTYDCELLYTVFAQQRYVKVDAKLQGAADAVRLGTGFSKFYEDVYFEKAPDFMAAVAENVYEQGVMERIIGRGLVTVGPYATNEVDIPADGKLSKIPANGPNYGLTFPPGEHQITYAFVAAWGKDDGVTSTAQWRNYLKDLSARVNLPLEIHY